MANGVTQLYKVYSDYIDGQIAELTQIPTAVPFIPILVTLEYMLLKMPIFEDRIKGIVMDNLIKKGLDAHLVEKYMFHIIPIELFEAEVQIMMIEGFDNWTRHTTKEGKLYDETYRKSFEFKNYFFDNFVRDFIEPYD